MLKETDNAITHETSRLRPAGSHAGDAGAQQGRRERRTAAGHPKLVELRASQINGCSVCVDMHARELQKAGEPDKRIFAVAAWREVPYFTEAERAALALTEAATRIADRADPVPDDIWLEARRHYDDEALSALILDIATINVWNRLNVVVKQVVGAAWG
jgi:AhpD family alkylhydroperoxidase